MEQERNSNRNAELAMEQNGNMIDGIINNLPVLPRSEKPLDKVRERLTSLKKDYETVQQGIHNILDS